MKDFFNWILLYFQIRKEFKWHLKNSHIVRVDHIDPGWIKPFGAMVNNDRRFTYHCRTYQKLVEIIYHYTRMIPKL
jgi:hypothetical protein